MKRYLHWLTHWWKIALETPAWLYVECEVCGERRAFTIGPGFSPRNRDWLEHRVDDPAATPVRVPPRGGSSTAPPRPRVPPLGCCVIQVSAAFRK